MPRGGASTTGHVAFYTSEATDGPLDLLESGREVHSYMTNDFTNSEVETVMDIDPWLVCDPWFHARPDGDHEHGFLTDRVSQSRPV